MDKLFNVYKINTDSFRAEEELAHKVDLPTLLQWEETSNIDKLRHHIAGYEVGSPRDLELSLDLT